MHETMYPFITRKLQQAIENGSTPGVSLLVDKDGELVYRYAVGYAQQYPEHKDLTEHTFFDLSSLTNVIATTTAVMLLLRDQQIRLDAPVQTYLPEWPQPQITIAHLLTHSSGLPPWMPLYEDVQQEAKRQGQEFIGSADAQKFVFQRLCQTTLISSPSEHYTYSDLGFLLLGYVLEKITGRPLDQYCSETIFAPLGMTNTFFRKHGDPLRPGDYAATERCEWRQRILVGEVHDENAYAIGGVAGHAGLFSTLDDLRIFMNTLRRCYEGTDAFLPQPIVQQFFSCQHLPSTSTRAFGWDTPSKDDSSGGELLSENSVGHTGVTGPSIWLDLQRKLLIVLCSNRVHPSRHNHKFLKMRPKIHDTVVITIERSGVPLP